MKKLFSLLSLLAFFMNGTAQTQIGADIYGETADNYSGADVSMPDIYTIAIGAVYNNDNGSHAGHVRVYRWNGVAWVQKGIDIDGEAAGDQFGSSLAMPDSNTLAVGAQYNDGNAFQGGHVRVFYWNGSAWMQKGADIDGIAMGDNAGWVTMPDANTVAVGAPSNSGGGLYDQGQVRIFTWNGNAWVQKGSDIYGEAANDGSGSSINMPDSNTIAINAHANDGNGPLSGHVRIFGWNGNAWVQKGADIDGEAAGDQSGSCVDMPDNNTVAIGAMLNTGNGYDAGHARIYSWNGSAWIQKGADIDGLATYNRCGNTLSMPNTNTIAVSSPQYDGKGQTRIFSWNGNAWVQQGSAIIGDTTGDFSGTGLSMPDVSTFAVGASSNGGNGIHSGQVKIFRLCDHTTDTIAVSACDSYISPSGNHIWTISGTYLDTIANATGCDSAITINLIVNTVNVSVTNASPVLTANANGASYQWIYCDSIVIAGETGQNFTPILNGNYAVIVTQNGCTDTSACIQVNLESVLNNSFGNKISVYPNPARDEFFFDLGAKYDDIHVMIRNELGQEISSTDYHSVQILQIELNAAPGFYFIELKTTGGQKALIKVLKE